MYHAIVKRVATRNFTRVDEKDHDALLKDCAPDVHHRFGGERHDRQSLARWFDRLGRVSPTLTLTVRDVWVKGAPWNTTIIMRWTATTASPKHWPTPS